MFLFNLKTMTEINFYYCLSRITLNNLKISLMTVNKKQRYTNIMEPQMSSKLTLRDTAFYLASCLQIPTRIFNKDGVLVKKYFDWNISQDPLMTDRKFLTSMLNKGKLCYPFLIKEENIVLYSGTTDTEENTLIVGPFVDVADDITDKVKFHAFKHNSTLTSIIRCSKKQVLSILGLYFTSQTGRMVNIEQETSQQTNTYNLDTDIARQITSVISRQIANSTPHNDASFENRIRDSIASGNKASLIQSLDTPFSGKRGIIGHTPLRAKKNLAIVDITIVSRAAIDAGVNAEIAYIISDGYILSLELLSNAEDIDRLYRKCAFEFCELVKKTKENTTNTSDFLVSKVENYIQKNFQNKITVCDIANYLKLSKDYLMLTYRKRTGHTIMDHLRHVRVAAAKNLLTNTEEDFLEIAIHTGFNSQSHFISCFKKETGKTPKQYRQCSFTSKTLFFR